MSFREGVLGLAFVSMVTYVSALLNFSHHVSVSSVLETADINGLECISCFQRFITEQAKSQAHSSRPFKQQHNHRTHTVQAIAWISGSVGRPITEGQRGKSAHSVIGAVGVVYVLWPKIYQAMGKV